MMVCFWRRYRARSRAHKRRRILEHDKLNVWSNLNDTESEQKFYRTKFEVC